MTPEIKLTTGLQPFNIRFNNDDEVTTIYFDPTDADLPKRMFEAQKRIEEKTAKIKQFEIDENGIPKTDEYIETMNQLNQAVYDIVDYAFGNKIADKVFSRCSPFSIPNGEYFIIQFFQAITPILEGIIKRYNKKANENIQKHINKYMPKK